MFENIKSIFRRAKKKELLGSNSKDAAKERLHLVLVQDRANVSADFLDLMRKEIVEVIKKYIEIDEEAMDVRLTTETNEDGVKGVPALYANIPILNIKDETRKLSKVNQDREKIQPPKEQENEEVNELEKENIEEIDKSNEEKQEENNNANEEIVEENNDNEEKNEIIIQNEAEKSKESEEIEEDIKETENSNTESDSDEEEQKDDERSEKEDSAEDSDEPKKENKEIEENKDEE